MDPIPPLDGATPDAAEGRVVSVPKLVPLQGDTKGDPKSFTTQFRMEVASSTDLHPRVAGLLKGIADGECFHLHYSLRHPGAIFNLTFHQVLSALDAVVMEVLQGRGIDRDALALRYLTLLLALNDFSDSFYEILLAAAKPAVRPPLNRPLWRWLHEQRYSAAKAYHEKLRATDAAYFRDMFNALKHSSSTLRVLKLLSSGEVITGYYVESGSSSGAIGPDVRFHPLWGPKHTANSFMRDLRRIHQLIYVITDAMASCLLQHYQEVYGRTLELLPWADRRNDRHLKMLQNVCRLPRRFFPNEAGKLVAYASLAESDSTTALVFCETEIRMPPDRYKFEFATHGDGYTRSFILPFFVGGQP